MNNSYKYMQECLTRHYAGKTDVQLLALMKMHGGAKKRQEFKDKIFKLTGRVI